MSKTTSPGEHRALSFSLSLEEHHYSRLLQAELRALDNYVALCRASIVWHLDMKSKYPNDLQEWHKSRIDWWNVRLDTALSQGRDLLLDY